MSVYIHARMNAGVVWDEINIWKGIKPHSLACDYHFAEQWAPLHGDYDADGLVLQSGLKVRMPVPGKVLLLDYEDPARDTAFHLTWEAVSQRLPWLSGCHYDQLCRVRGSCTLRGERMEVDTIALRDRDWHSRREDSIPGVPCGEHISVILDERNAFCVSGTDLETAQLFPGAPTAEDTEFISAGWRLKDGVYRRVRRFECRVRREAGSWIPASIEGLAVDEENEVLEIRGKATSMFPQNLFSNNITTIGTLAGTINGEPFTGRWNDSFDNDVMCLLLAR